MKHTTNMVMMLAVTLGLILVCSVPGHAVQAISIERMSPLTACLPV